MPRKLFRRWLPNPKTMREHRMLSWLGDSLHHPRVWHVSREGIALGAATGVFFGVLIPLAQVPIAAMAAILLRANLPVAVVSTFISNPFTFAPLYYGAYRLGLLLLGAEHAPAVAESAFEAEPHNLLGWVRLWAERIQNLGKPLIAGLFVTSTTLSLFSYFAINWLWRVLTMRAWRRRGGRRKTHSA